MRFGLAVIVTGGDAVEVTLVISIVHLRGKDRTQL